MPHLVSGIKITYKTTYKKLHQQRLARSLCCLAAKETSFVDRNNPHNKKKKTSNETECLLPCIFCSSSNNKNNNNNSHQGAYGHPEFIFRFMHHFFPIYTGKFESKSKRNKAQLPFSFPLGVHNTFVPINFILPESFYHHPNPSSLAGIAFAFLCS